MRAHIASYSSPLGQLYLVSNGSSLLSISFSPPNDIDSAISDDDAISAAKSWLNRYFSGENPSLNLVPFVMNGTAFEMEVWSILLTIPYGKTMTYGEIASLMAEKRGIKRMSAQAVGGAVGRNKLPILIPCHRVMGKNGAITGYTGGIEKKIKLLEIENISWRW